jgi:hypothetical protein
MWMRPGGRPMVKTTPGPARPATGQDSPFTGQNLAWAYGLQGAVLATAPIDYEPPPEPFVAATYPAGPDPGGVSWF